MCVNCEDVGAVVLLLCNDREIGDEAGASAGLNLFVALNLSTGDLAGLLPVNID